MDVSGFASTDRASGVIARPLNLDVRGRREHAMRDDMSTDFWRGVSLTALGIALADLISGRYSELHVLMAVISLAAGWGRAPPVTPASNNHWSGP